MKIEKSAFLEQNQAKMQKIVKKLGEKFSYVSILGTDVYGVNYLVTTRQINVGASRDEERGFVVRVFNGKSFSEFSFNDIDVDFVVEKMQKIAGDDRKIFEETISRIEYKAEPTDEKIVKEYFVDVNEQVKDIDDEKIINILKNAISNKVEQNEKLAEMQARYSITQVNKYFFSKNKQLKQSYIYSTLAAIAIASDGEKVKIGFLPASGNIGTELLDQVDDLVKAAITEALELMNCVPVEAGEYDIICNPNFTGLIAHEAFGHGAEMDMFVKNRAKGKEYMHKEVASDKITMHDGAAALGEVSSYMFDDEGNIGQDTIIIDKGILVSGMCDELSALQLGIKPTGNGKRESYKRKAYTRMTNTFFAGGDDNLDDMIASVKHGYLLENFSSGMEDPKNWSIQCVAAKGREIKDGKFTGKIVSPLYLTGYVPDLLKSINAVTANVKMSGSGYCGKGHKEYVKTSTGGSYIKAKGRLN